MFKFNCLGVIMAVIAADITCMAASPAFEGEISVRNFRNYSDAALAMAPSACNGVDTLVMVVKGDRGYIKDYRTQLVTICDPDTYVQYSLKDNTGVKCPFLSAGSLPALNPTKTDQTRTMLGEDVALYVVENNANLGIEFQAWVSDNKFSLPGFILQTLNMGVVVDGLPLKFVYNVGGNTPMYMCQEILSISPRDVDDSEFNIPDNISLDEVKTFDKYKYRNKMMSAAEKFSSLPKDVMRFSDFVSDFMQKHPASAVPAPTKTYDLDEDWDF